MFGSVLSLAFTLDLKELTGATARGQAAPTINRRFDGGWPLPAVPIPRAETAAQGLGMTAELELGLLEYFPQV